MSRGSRSCARISRQNCGSTFYGPWDRSSGSRHKAYGPVGSGAMARTRVRPCAFAGLGSRPGGLILRLTRGPGFAVVPGGTWLARLEMARRQKSFRTEAF